MTRYRGTILDESVLLKLPTVTSIFRQPFHSIIIREFSTPQEISCTNHASTPKSTTPTIIGFLMSEHQRHTPFHTRPSPTATLKSNRDPTPSTAYHDNPDRIQPFSFPSLRWSIRNRKKTIRCLYRSAPKTLSKPDYHFVASHTFAFVLRIPSFQLHSPPNSIFPQYRTISTITPIHNSHTSNNYPHITSLSHPLV